MKSNFVVLNVNSMFPFNAELGLPDVVVHSLKTNFILTN